ncbi:hypothetical protein [Leucobacter tardus]|nr:hypothetical protein [Leucobacter tardus]
MPEDTWRGNSRGSRARGDDARTQMVQRAIDHVESVGLTLGASEGVVQQLAADAGLSQRQFAQLWPSTELFLADVFCELADQARIDRANTETLLTTWQYLSARTEDLRSAEGRRRVLIDVIRTAAEYNFDVVTASSKWRTYAALSTTIMSWPDEAVRTRILDALRASELAFAETMESFYRNVLPTVGYRLKPVYRGDYQPFVVAAASVIEGLGIVRTTVPTLVEARFDFPVGEGSEEWSIASLAFVGVVDAFIEPDPAFVPEEAIGRLSSGVDVSPHASAESER